MSIPLATTSLTIERKTYVRDPDAPADVDPWGEGYDEDQDATPDAVEDWTVVAAAVPANIGGPSGRVLEGDAQRVEFTLVADPCDLRPADRIRDESTGRVYTVGWTVPSPGIAGLLASTRAGIYEIIGFGQEETAS